MQMCEQWRMIAEVGRGVLRRRQRGWETDLKNPFRLRGGGGHGGVLTHADLVYDGHVVARGALSLHAVQATT